MIAPATQAHAMGCGPDRRLAIGVTVLKNFASARSRGVARRLTRLVAVALLSFGLAGAAAAEESPSDLVRQLNAVLLEVMQNSGSLGYSGRLTKLTPVLESSFNYPLMARVAVSKYWRSLDSRQKQRLTSGFAKLSSATFAARFDNYNGERFRIVDESPKPRNTVLVTNHLVKASGDVVGLNYLLRKSKDRWRIVDVYLDSKYSELAIKRSEFTSVIANKGFEALISEIDLRVSEIARSAGG